MSDPSEDRIDVWWKDKKVSLVGLHTIVVVILVVALTWMGFLLRESVQGTQEVLRAAIEEHTRAQTTEHQAMSEEFRRSFGQMHLSQNKLADAMDAQTYLMTKTERERQLYKLDMPESLRRKIH